MALMIIIYTILGFVLGSQKDSGHSLYTAVGLAEPIEFITPANLPKGYLVHFLGTIAGLFLLNSIAALKVRMAERKRMSCQIDFDR